MSNGSVFWRVVNGEPEAVTSRLPGLVLCGFLGCYLCAKFDLPGLMTMFQFSALSVAGATFASYRRDRGLWMLAALFLLIWLPITVALEVSSALDLLRGNAPFVSPLAVDFGLSMIVMRTHVTFLWKVARFNLVMSRCKPEQ